MSIAEKTKLDLDIHADASSRAEIASLLSFLQNASISGHEVNLNGIDRFISQGEFKDFSGEAVYRWAENGNLITVFLHDKTWSFFSTPSNSVRN